MKVQTDRCRLKPQTLFAKVISNNHAQSIGGASLDEPKPLGEVFKDVDQSGKPQASS
jgi:hypothetical protein